MNKIVLMGRLTRDPEVKVTTNNVVYARFSIAVDRRFAKDGQQSADFVPIVVWNKTAEFVSMYFKKGMRVAISGRLEVRQYNDETGSPRTFTEVVGEDVYFADSKRDSNTADTYGFRPTVGQTTNTPKPQNNKVEDVDFSDFAGADDFNIEIEDDINFID